MKKSTYGGLKQGNETFQDGLIFLAVTVVHLVLLYLLCMVAGSESLGETLEFEMVNVGSAGGGVKAAAGAVATAKPTTPPAPSVPLPPKPAVKSPPVKNMPKMLTAKDADNDFHAAAVPVKKAQAIPPAPVIKKSREKVKEVAAEPVAAVGGSAAAGVGRGSAAGLGNGGAGGFNKGNYQQIGPKIYPAASRSNYEEGAATVRVKVNAAGQTESVVLIKSSGFTRLDRAAVDTAQTKYRYFPNRRGGMAEPTVFTFNIVFRLDD